MCSLHADRLQEGRQADGSDCTWKSWGNGDVFKETYIDKGAHPNVLSLGQYLDFTDWDENNRLKNTGLECSDEEAVRPTCKQPRQSQDVRPTARFAVPGWTDEKTRQTPCTRREEPARLPQCIFVSTCVCPQ
jgi:hypothetical protein